MLRYGERSHPEVKSFASCCDRTPVMAKIVTDEELALDDLTIGRGQIRLRDVAAGIDDLARSIEKQGLLQPIVVCPIEGTGTYEIILGQRRFLACKQLGWRHIRAQVLDERIDEIEAKVLSLTENMVRRDISRRDKIDVCTALYKRYGTMKDVAEETGLPLKDVSQFVKYERLDPALKNLVDHDEVPLSVALRAQDAAAVAGPLDPGEAVMLAKEMAGLSGAQGRRLIRAREEAPDRPVDEVIESAKEQVRVTQVVVTLGPEAHSALQTFTKEEGTTQDDAAGTLIVEALQARGFEL